MQRIPLVRAALFSLVALAACAPPRSTPFIFAPAGGQPTLRPFRTQAEFDAVNDQLRRELERLERRSRYAPAPPPPPPPSPGSESVTNVQTQGVDEGGIVKVHGEHLVVLRRGRLFTIRIGGDALQPAAVVDAFGPGIDPRYTWYDEMLISGDNVVVIGYSYERGGTELGIFRIGADGSLAHRTTYHLRSSDYYSSRNYASRLIGSRLIFYAPIPLRTDLAGSLPAMRRWGGADSAWIPTVSTRRIYRPAMALRAEDSPVLHTVTSCELGGDDLRCESTALLGPPGRKFYVSAGSVYLWTSLFARYDQEPSSTLYRMPLDGSAPTALGVRGVPIDQFSFLESGDGHIQVLTRLRAYPESDKDGRPLPMRMSLLRVSLSVLTDGSRDAGADAYRGLPDLPRDRSPQNRFVGDWLLYGAGAGWGAAQPGASTAYAVRWTGGGEVAELALPHQVDRIEAMAPGAVLIGGDGQALHVTSVRLDASTARAADRYTLPGASQGETRSHGFFYRPDGDDAGVLGLPVRGAERPAYEHLRLGSASILFLRNQALRLRELGELAADTAVGSDDGCLASCVDWYGNARPLFLRGRVFALMGYELVEGALDDGRIRERRRVSFAPAVPPRRFAGDWAFTETIGGPTEPYHCASRGIMRLDQDGDAVTLRYRQTGECTIEGATRSSAGEGAGRGTTRGNALTLQVEGCRYDATFGAPDWISGPLQCTVRMPGGAERVVNGRWEARRTQP